MRAGPELEQPVDDDPLAALQAGLHHPVLAVPIAHLERAVLGAPDERARFLALSVAELEARGLPYALIRGDGEARLASALKAVDQSISV